MGHVGISGAPSMFRRDHQSAPNQARVQFESQFTSTIRPPVERISPQMPLSRTLLAADPLWPARDVATAFGQDEPQVRMEFENQPAGISKV